MKPVILAVPIMAVFAAPVAAQERCIEPIRPEAAYLLDAGFSGAEVRSEFRRYFSEVEDYLNCLNETSARIREDAQAAVHDYQHVLETTVPDKADPAVDGFQPPSLALYDTGELFLDFLPKAERSNVAPR